MAQLKHRLFSGLSGSIDNLIFYQMDGKTYVRSKPVDYKDRRSPAQLAQRQKLKLVGRFLAPFKKMLKQTFLVNESKTTAYQNAFSYNMKYGITGDYPGLRIDKANVRLSMGPVGLPSEITMQTQPDGWLIEWDTDLTNEHCSTDDTFILMATHPYYEEGYYHFTGVRRREGHFLWNSNLFEGQSHPDVWIAFRNAEETMLSESRYIAVTADK